MGSACCVAARDKVTLPIRSDGESLQTNNVRYSPTWSFRWDNRGQVAGEETSLSWLSDGLSRNDGSDFKFESEFVSSEGSPLGSFRTQTWQKSPQSDQSFPRNSSMDGVSEQRPHSIKSSAPSYASNSKLSPSLASQPSSFSTSPLSFQSNLQQHASSSTTKLSHRPPPTSKQVSDSQICRVNSPRNSATEEKQGSCWSNDSRCGPADAWSMHAFSEQMSFSRGESFSYENDFFGLQRDKIDSHGNRASSDQQTCGACSRNLTEKSLWIITANDLSVVSVLGCGHVYHSECLEHMTPEVDKFDPACPICTMGEKKTLRLSEKALRAEMEMKGRYNRRVRNRVMDSDFECDDLIMYGHAVSGSGHKGKSPKLLPSSSAKSNSPRPFLARHFSFGSRGSGKASRDSHHGRKKGFFWAKSCKI